MKASPPVSVNRLGLFERKHELERLTGWTADRRSFLFCGPAGVGKTTLLDEVCLVQPGIIRLSACHTPQMLFHELALFLWTQRQTDFRARFKSINHLKSTSAANLKALCLNRDYSANVLVLEHPGFSSQQLAATVKQIRGEAGLPVVFVCRSSHMEDAGYLVRHYPDRSEKFELLNFKPELAARFAHLIADQNHLEAKNREDFLSKVSAFSDGNPGSIVTMVGMARSPKYRSANSIKFSPLYIDFHLARHGGSSIFA